VPVRRAPAAHRYKILHVQSINDDGEWWMLAGWSRVEATPQTTQSHHNGHRHANQRGHLRYQDMAPIKWNQCRPICNQRNPGCTDYQSETKLGHSATLDTIAFRADNANDCGGLKIRNFRCAARCEWSSHLRIIFWSTFCVFTVTCSFGEPRISINCGRLLWRALTAHKFDLRNDLQRRVRIAFIIVRC